MFFVLNDFNILKMKLFFLSICFITHEAPWISHFIVSWLPRSMKHQSSEKKDNFYLFHFFNKCSLISWNFHSVNVNKRVFFSFSNNLIIVSRVFVDKNKNFIKINLCPQDQLFNKASNSCRWIYFIIPSTMF